MKTKYTVKFTNQFKKDYKLAIKHNLDISKLQYVIKELANGKTLEEKYHNHLLSGRWHGHYECHIEPNWLLIYYIKNDTIVLSLSRTGTHSDLLEK